MRRLAPTLLSCLLGLAPASGCGDGGASRATDTAGASADADAAPADIVDATSGEDAGGDDVVTVDAAADAGVDATPDTSEPTDPSALLFDPGRVLEVEIAIAPADWAALRAETRSLLSVIGPGCLDGPAASPFSWFRADAVIDGVTALAVGVRKKGFLGSLDPVRPSLKLRTNKYIGGQEVHGVDRFTFNNGRQDPTRFAACLTYATFRAAGVPAPRCNLAHLTVNGEDLGVYTHVEDVKKDFMRRHTAEPFGDLYEGQLSDFREGWTRTFEKQIDADAPPGALLDRVTAALLVPDAGALDALDAVVDLDEVVTFWAVEVLVNHWDGYAGNTNNFFAYEDGPGGRLQLLPWGADATFSAGRGDAPDDPDASPIFTLGALVNRLWSLPEGRARFGAAMARVLTIAWDEGALRAAIDGFDALARPLHRPGDRVAAQAAAAGTRAFVNGRRARIEGALSGAPAPAGDLRPEPCLHKIGTVSGELATTWGTLGEENFFLTGTGSLTLDVPTFQGTLGTGGSRAGWDPEQPALGHLQLIVQADVGAYVVVDLGVEPGVVVTGTTADLDVDGVQATLYTFTEAAGGQLIGIITGGELLVTRGGTGPGDPVEASFYGDLLSF